MAEAQKHQPSAEAVEPQALPVGPRVYVDTNIILDDVYKRRDDSRGLLLALREEKITTVTSYWTYLEALNHLYRAKYVGKGLLANENLDAILRNRNQRNLDPKEIYEQYSLWYKEYTLVYSSFISFVDLTLRGWEKIFEIVRESNIEPADSLHIGTALEAGCGAFITHDSFLTKEMERIGFEKLGMVVGPAKDLLDVLRPPAVPATNP